MKEGAPKFEEEIDLPPAPPTTEDPAAWEEYNQKREEWERRQMEKDGGGEG